MQEQTDKSSSVVSYPENRWIAMAVMLIASFMNLIDVTIVNVAIPSMQKNLGATSGGIEWVVAGYLLAFALALLPFGRLGDTLGQRRLFLIGVGAFTVASLACGLAPNIESLIAARIMQGLAGGMMTPQTLSIAQVIFPPHERGTAFALFGLSAGMAAVTGPVLGGLLIGADIFGLDWRPIFLVNIPVGLLAIAAGLHFIPAIPGERALGIDVGGILLAVLTLLLAIFPLIEGRELGWPLWCFVMMAMAIPAGSMFIAWQFRQARRERPQLLPVNILTNGNFMIGTLVSAVFFSGVPSFFFVLAIFLQIGFGLSPIESGITSLPFSTGVLLASIISGKFGRNFTRQRMVSGALMLLIAMTWLRLVTGTLTDSFSHWQFLAPLLLGGLGLGTAISPLFQTTLSRVTGRDAGSAAGGLQTFQQVGGATGVAVVGMMFFTRLTSATATGGDQHAAFVMALQHALIYGICSFGFVVVAAFLLPPVKMDDGSQQPVAATNR